MSQPKSPPDWHQYLPVLLIAAAGFLLYLGLSGGSDSSSKGGKVLVHDEKIQSSVNEKLRKTAEKMEMDRRAQSIRSQALVNDFNRTVAEHAFTAPTEGSRLQENDSAGEVARDLGRTAGQYSAEENGSASDMIHQQLFEAQVAKSQDAAYKAEYARQFKENARRAGWEVTLDENFKVISSKRLRRPSSGGGGGGYDLFK